MCVCVCAASLELLVVFSVRDVGFKKMSFLGAGSVFAFLILVYYILTDRQTDRQTDRKGAYISIYIYIYIYIHIYIY